MKYSSPLQRVKLIKRYKRFLADVVFDDGSELTVHTPNTGSMLGCSTPENFIWIRDAENPKRKYRYSWELSELKNGQLVGVNTGLANQLVIEGIAQGIVPELGAYDEIKTEVPYGEERSRIDILLSSNGYKRPPCYVEVKNVTARAGECAIFPDAVTVRGQKHLRELIKMVKQGNRAVIFFCVQRPDVTTFRAAHEIDPVYAETLIEAEAAGVDVLAYRASLSPEEIVLVEKLPVIFEC